MASNSSYLLGSKRVPTRSGGGRRWPRRLAYGFIAFAIALPLAYLVFLRMTRIEPPPVDPAVRAAAQEPVVVRGVRAYLGKSWMSRERGIWEEHLEGGPYALGYAQARLGSRLLREQEDYMFSEMNKWVPSKIARFLIRAGVRLRYRHLADFIPLERQLEMAGLADGSIDRHSDFLPAYHRIVFYHALHDITQGLEHSPLLGCSAFAAGGAATPGGHLILGRNFDFEGPPIFDSDKSVLFFKPTGKIPFASVAWTGMSGVVTGINAEGIFVSLNAARTDDKGKEGMPVEILMRQIMEQARSIKDVVAMVKKTPLMVPDFYLVGDGKTGEAAVIERSPTRTEVRRTSQSTGSIVVTNHALTPAFAGDAENDRLKRYLTSGARYDRLSELVKKWHGQIDPQKALEILRDKKGVGGVALGLGNRNALDAIIATHSVVVDATNLILWVSQGPHLSGRYIGFDLKKELGGPEYASRPNPPDLPADPILDTDEYRNFVLAKASLAAAEQLWREHDPDRALEEVRRAEGLEEAMPEPHKLAGDALRARGDREGARKEYQRFLQLYPPHLKEVEEVRSILATL
ncbi:MAG TPA: C45 family peptidase [Polyangia bacterium]